MRSGAITSKLLTRKPDVLFEPISAVPYVASSAMLGYIQRTLSSQALCGRIKNESRCAPACAQEDFMRLLLARKPDPFFDTVSVVLYLASSAMLGRIELQQYRAVVDAALARGGMVSSNSNIWKGLSLLTVRQRTGSVLNQRALQDYCGQAARCWAMWKCMQRAGGRGPGSRRHGLLVVHFSERALRCWRYAGHFNAY